MPNIFYEIKLEKKSDLVDTVCLVQNPFLNENALFMMAPGKKKSQPKYLQLKEALLVYLNDELYGIDQKLPTEHALMEQFHVSRGTIRQALAELEFEGVLYKKQGSGTFFSGKKSGGKSHQGSTTAKLIGVLTPSIDTYIFPQVIQGISDVIQQHGYSIALGTSKTSPGQEFGCIEQLMAQGIGGLLFNPPHALEFTAKSPLFGVLKRLKIPLVFMGVAIDDDEISYVSLDDVNAGRKATNYLIEAGHRRIACLHPTGQLSGWHRYQGYRHALDAHQIVYDDRLDKVIDNGKNATQPVPTQIAFLIKQILALGNERPTAIVFYNDTMTLHGYRCLEEAGLRIPDDMSLISFDDSERALQPAAQLTGVIHPKYYLGKWAAEMLLGQIEAPAPHFPLHLLIAPTLAERDSVKRLSH